jgi:hypothetical protein
MNIDSRQEHLDWCKSRALEYLEKNDLKQAFTSFASDLQKHPETANHLRINLGMRELLKGNLYTTEEMQLFINSFN